MLRYVRRILELGPQGAWDLLVLATLAAIAEFGVRFRPLPQVARWFRVRLAGEPPLSRPWRMGPRQRRRRRIINMLTRHWPFVDHEGLCLRRSLLIGWVLHDRDPVLRIGLARVDGEITAHAWLEVEGGEIGAGSVHRPLSFGDRDARLHDGG